eukprot:IDg11961t1
MVSSFVPVVLVLALIQACSASGSGSGSVPPPVCFIRKQKCCYKFSACGSVTRRIRTIVPCPVTKCSNVCKKECSSVPTNVSKKVCYDKKAIVGQICKKVKKYIKHQVVYKTVCTPKYGIKKVCTTKNVVVNKTVCKDVCKNVCKTVQGSCIKIKVVQFPKFCPSLSCVTVSTSGNSKNPGEVVGKDGKTIKVLDGGQ